MHYKLRLVYTVFLAALCALVFLGNKNGRASSQGKGNTGAPGDEPISVNNPTIRTCVSCHNTGPITASIAIAVLDADTLPVTQYVPGQQYTARVTITASGPALARYGFQMIALRDAGNTDLDGFTDTNPNNYKIATIANGRTYAEHDNSSTLNTFNVAWQAPVAGTGPITFYAAGNGVNNNGQDSGDGAATTTLKLTEQSASPTHEGQQDRASMSVLPTILENEAWLNIELMRPGRYGIAAIELSSGRVIWQTEQSFSTGINRLSFSTANWSRGIYGIVLTGNGRALTVKAAKL